MFMRRRLRSIAALAALLVSWTTGPGAAFCVAEEMGPSEDAHHAHAAASAHGAHGMHHVPEPAGEERAPVEAPACPWMAMSGGSGLVASAPALAASPAGPPPLAEHAPPRGAPGGRWWARGGGSCRVASAPALAASSAAPPPLAEYPHPEAVRDQLLA